MAIKHLLIILSLLLCSCTPVVNNNSNCTYTIENIDSEIVSYRIDIKTYEPIDNWSEIDSKIRIKCSNINVEKFNKDSLINVLLEELPVRPKEIHMLVNL